MNQPNFAPPPPPPLLNKVNLDLGNGQVLSMPVFDLTALCVPQPGWHYAGDGGVLKLEHELVVLPEPSATDFDDSPDSIEVRLGKRVSGRVKGRQVFVVGLGEPLSHAIVGTARRTPPQGIARLVVPGLELFEVGKVAFIFMVGPLFPEIRRAVLESLKEHRILSPAPAAGLPADDPLPKCPYLLLLAGEELFPFWDLPEPPQLPMSQPVFQPPPAPPQPPKPLSANMLNLDKIKKLHKAQRSMDALQRGGGGLQPYQQEHKA